MKQLPRSAVPKKEHFQAEAAGKRFFVVGGDFGKKKKVKLLFPGH